MRKLIGGVAVSAVFLLLTGCGGGHDEKSARQYFVQFMYDVTCSDKTKDAITSEYAADSESAQAIGVMYDGDRGANAADPDVQSDCSHWPKNQYVSALRTQKVQNGYKLERGSDAAGWQPMQLMVADASGDFKIKLSSGE